MAGQQSNGRADLSDPMVITVIIVLIYVAISIVWLVAHAQISMIYVYIRYAMSYPFYLLSGLVSDVPILNYPYNYIQHYCNPEPGLLGKCRVDFSQFEWQDLKDMSMPWNIFFGIFLVFILGKAFIGTNTKHPQAAFAKKHNLKSFIQEQKQLYPHLHIFTEMDLISEPINHPLYGMLLTSKQFAGIYVLAKEEEPTDWDGPLVDGSYSPIIDQERMREVLVAQLGNTWQGWNKLSDTEWVIFASLLPLVAATDETMSDEDYKLAQKEAVTVREKAWKMFQSREITPEQEALGLVEDELASLWLLEVQINRNDFLSIIEKYRKSKTVQAILSRHAYVRTIIHGLFLEARRLGVLEPADYRWLHYCDRSLWCTVSSIGRNRPFAEAAAIHNHFSCEELAGEPLFYPQISNAMVGIIAEIQTYKYPTRRLLKGDYSMWLQWRVASIERLYPGINLARLAQNLK